MQFLHEEFKEKLHELTELSSKINKSDKQKILEMIKEHTAASVSIEVEDFNYAPFYEKGGVVRLHKLFGSKVEKILKELNEVLVSD